MGGWVGGWVDMGSNASTNHSGNQQRFSNVLLLLSIQSHLASVALNTKDAAARAAAISPARSDPGLSGVRAHAGRSGGANSGGPK